MDIVVYDTTLRDGMQGEGMSLSVEEKVRVARILDELGVPMIEAGFPTSNPKELELFERLQEAGLTAAVCAFGMTRRRGVAAEEDAALRVLAESWTPVSHDRRQDLGPAPGEGRQGRPRREPADDRGVRRLPAKRRQARRLRRRALLRRLRATTPPTRVECLRAAHEAGAENLTMCDTNGASLPHDVAAAVRAVRRRAPARPRSASTPTTTPRSPSPTRWPRSPRAPRWSRAR